ncbi:MAG TPA: helix-turn-helix domain-containing protein [Solirubrobacteraceae bacterium]
MEDARAELISALERYLAIYKPAQTSTPNDAEDTDQRSIDWFQRALIPIISLLAEIATDAAKTRHCSQAVNHSAQNSQQSVEMLLHRMQTDERPDPRVFDYNFDLEHLGAIAVGTDSERVLTVASEILGRRLLAVPQANEILWAWLSGRTACAATEVERAIKRAKGCGTMIAIGEPAHGIEGFHSTHRQAQAALEIAQCKHQPVTLFADVVVEIACLRDTSTARSLESLYIAPLRRGRDGGSSTLMTLRAYLNCDCNATSTASLLKIDRRTVEYRVRAAERRLGRPLMHHRTEIDIALRLHALHATRPLD